MAQERTVSKSLIEQILDEMFDRLEKVEKLDADTVRELKLLAATGGLTKPVRVAEAIKLSTRRQP